jgi:IS5 family transposase
MSQISFADAEYAGKRKKTRREVFLEEMELVVPWKVLLEIIEPHYPVAGRGRRPYALESMLRVHLMQNWFALSDPAMEEALYEIASLRSFAKSEPERAHSGRDDHPELSATCWRPTIWPTTC